MSKTYKIDYYGMLAAKNGRTYQMIADFDQPLDQRRTDLFLSFWSEVILPP
jgi:hypothetical protein